jgi:hypothetical protein
MYVVTAYRWGLRDCHSYVVGAYADFDVAKSMAERHVEYRGGKYGCEVEECKLEDVPSTLLNDEGNAKGCRYYVESPYFGMAGLGRQPADTSKPLIDWEAKKKEVEERKLASL